MTQTKNKKNKKRTINLAAFNKILYILIIIFGVYYLIGVNDLSVKGFRLQESKNKINQLINENNKLELKTMSLQSYNNLSQKVKELNMVAVNEIDYLSGAAVIVVKK